MREQAESPRSLPEPSTAPASSRSFSVGRLYGRKTAWAWALALAVAYLPATACVRLPKDSADSVGHRPTELRRDGSHRDSSADNLDGAREEPAQPTRSPPATDVTVHPASDRVELLGQVPPDRDTAQDLVLGQFPLSRTRPIIDGDTIRVDGLDATLRLLSIDTEEVFRSEADRRAAELDFAAYARAKQADNPYPVSYGTPMGSEATRFAERFFAGHATVLLEYDHPTRKRGYFGRHLVYVFAVKNGEWVNYNLEAVRAGMTPYYVKYGYSTRFHDEFVHAQEEAMNERRGIWAPGVQAYPDYDVRLTWWKHRADTLARFHRLYGANPRFVEVGSDGSLERLLALEGEVVTIFGAVGRERPREDPPFIVPFQHRRGTDFAIVAFRREDLNGLALHRHSGEYVYLRGKVTTYRGSPQILASNVERVWLE